VSDFADITKSSPEKSLLSKKTSAGGRNVYGRVTSRHQGGGHKQQYRLIDFKRVTDEYEAKVAAIEYDPNRSANIALLCYADGVRRYIIAPKGVAVGDQLMSGSEAPIKAGVRVIGAYDKGKDKGAVIYTETVISRTNYAEMYYSAPQQLAHHTTSGCAMNVGDLLGSGTISGPDKGSQGSLLELSWGGKEPFVIAGGTRSFIEDNDTLTLRGHAQGDGYRIGFGACAGKVIPALADPYKRT
jgi:hypothetical protein